MEGAEPSGEDPGRDAQGVVTLMSIPFKCICQEPDAKVCWNLRAAELGYIANEGSRCGCSCHKPERGTVPMEFTINVENWLRGTGEDMSFLHRSQDGKECCVGQYLRACGMPVEAINNIKAGRQIIVGRNSALPPQARWLVNREGIWHDTEDATELYSCNDDQIMSEQFRRKEIVRLFGLNGVQVKFSDEPGEAERC